MAKGRKTGGRQKGTPNKATVSVKQAILLAADGIGGHEALMEWGRSNPTEFWTRVYTRLLPTEISGPDGSAIRAVVLLPALDQTTA